MNTSLEDVEYIFQEVKQTSSYAQVRKRTELLRRYLHRNGQYMAAVSGLEHPSLFLGGGGGGGGGSLGGQGGRASDGRQLKQIL